MILVERGGDVSAPFGEALAEVSRAIALEQRRAGGQDADSWGLPGEPASAVHVGTPREHRPRE